MWLSCHSVQTAPQGMTWPSGQQCQRGDPSLGTGMDSPKPIPLRRSHLFPQTNPLGSGEPSGWGDLAQLGGGRSPVEHQGQDRVTGDLSHCQQAEGTVASKLALDFHTSSPHQPFQRKDPCTMTLKKLGGGWKSTLFYILKALKKIISLGTRFVIQFHH